MKIRIKGDFAGLDRFRDKLRTAPEVMETISANLAEETIELIRSGIESGKDPSGTRYAPLKFRSGKPLQDSGRLKASWHRKHSSKRRFSVASGVGYAKYHQGGTGIHGPKKRRILPRSKRALSFVVGGTRFTFRSVAGVPKRRMVPTRKLPKAWSQAYRDVALDVLEAHFKG